MARTAGYTIPETGRYAPITVESAESKTGPHIIEAHHLSHAIPLRMNSFLGDTLTIVAAVALAVISAVHFPTALISGALAALLMLVAINLGLIDILRH